MAKKPSVMLTDGGLWNNRRPQHNTETTRLLKSNTYYHEWSLNVLLLLCIALADEARINNFQHSQLTSNMLRKREIGSEKY